MMSPSFKGSSFQACAWLGASQGSNRKSSAAAESSMSLLYAVMVQIAAQDRIACMFQVYRMPRLCTPNGPISIYTYEYASAMGRYVRGVDRGRP